MSPQPGPPLHDERWARRLARRLLTIPGVCLGASLSLVLLPLWLPALALTDLLRGQRRLPLPRAALMGSAWLLAECLGCAAAGLSWLLTGGGLARARLRRLDLALQRAWTRALWFTLRTLYGLRLEREGQLPPPAGPPFLLFLRHSSLPDVLLPAVAFANPARIALRYVLKAEVCFSPCLDLVGHRLPNAFVRRDGRDPAREIARVRALHRDMGPGEGLVIYPEGTRFSPQRRQALIDRLEGAARERAASFRNVLPPRPGGPLALLAERGPEEELYICAHRGTEGAFDASAMARGALIGRTLQVAVWKVERGEIPEAAEAALAWLDEAWRQVDRWVGQDQGGGGRADDEL